MEKKQASHMMALLVLARVYIHQMTVKALIQERLSKLQNSGVSIGQSV